MKRKHILISSTLILAMLAPITLAGCAKNSAQPKTSRTATKTAETTVSKQTIKWLDKQQAIVFSAGDNDHPNNGSGKSSDSDSIYDNRDKKFNDARQRIRVWKREHTNAQWKYYTKHSKAMPETLQKGEASEYDTNTVSINAVVQLGLAMNKANQSATMGDPGMFVKKVNAISKQGNQEVKAWKKKYGSNAYKLSTIELNDSESNSDGKRGRTIRKKLTDDLLPLKQDMGGEFEEAEYINAN